MSKTDTSITSNVGKFSSSFSDSVGKIDTSPLKDAWSGEAATTVNDDLQTAMDAVTKIKDQVEKLKSILEEVDKLKELKDEIDALNERISELSGLISKADEDTDTSSWVSEKSKKEEEVKTKQEEYDKLKEKIKGELEGFESISSQISPKTSESLGVDVAPDYIVDLYEMLAKFNSGELSKLSDGDSLYNYYSKEEVEEKLNSIKSKYSGRDAAVNCALTVMGMAAAKGLKLDYDWGGGHTDVTSLDAVASGTDCSAFASWAINQGSPDTFHTMTTTGLINQGSREEYENAKKGDILVSNSHVVMIVDNDPETQQFLVAEASGSDTGVILRTRSYSSVSGSYQARDLSSIYGN